MKPDRRRSLRDVTTLRTLSDQSAPANRTQAVSRFARLENERARLLRELDAWVARKDAAERKLAALETELAGLKQALLGEPAAPAPRVRERAGATPDFQPPARRAEALIEY
jgi:chromosome segregation ATPase